MIRFRPNVAALLVRPEGQLLVCERASFRGAWQFPQGGVDAGEELLEALYREVREEVGLLPSHYDVIRSKDGYRYVYPPSVRLKKRKKHGFQGQEQTYFLCHLRAGAPAVNVNQKPQEFCAYRWIEPAEFEIEWLPEFKREVYRQVMLDFFGLDL